MTRSFILAVLLGAGAVMSPHVAFAQTTQATDTPAAVVSPMATDTSGATGDQTMGSSSSTTTTTSPTGGGYWGLLGLIGLLGLLGMRNRSI